MDLGKLMKKFVDGLTIMGAVLALLMVVWGVYRSMPGAEQMVAAEQVRIKKLCADGDQKACTYLQAVEGGKR